MNLETQLELWRYCGERAFLDGSARSENPALTPNPRDTDLEREVKRDVWWAAYDAARARYTRTLRQIRSRNAARRYC